jgi:signal peptidase I
MNIKSLAKKLWWFIWEDDSIWSWMVNFILAFVLIKFLVYPGLGAILGTGYPVVAVVSGSMEHDGGFDEWWLSEARCLSKECTQRDWYALKGITEDDFEAYSFTHGFNKGDIMVLQGLEPQNIKIGDVLVFVDQGSADPIIHRVVVINGDGENGFVYTTKGDHNVDSGDIDENIQDEAVIGKAIFRIPFLGWVKIVFISAVSVFI